MRMRVSQVEGSAALAGLEEQVGESAGHWGAVRRVDAQFQGVGLRIGVGDSEERAFVADKAVRGLDAEELGRVDGDTAAGGGGRAPDQARFRIVQIFHPFIEIREKGRALRPERHLQLPGRDLRREGGLRGEGHFHARLQAVGIDGGEHEQDSEEQNSQKQPSFHRMAAWQGGAGKIRGPGLPERRRPAGRFTG